MVVELNDVLPENCYSDFFYTGTILSCNLSDSIVIRSEPIYSGESILTTLTVDPPWAFKFEGGQRLETVLSTEQALSELGRAGEVMFLSFYNPPYLGYSGCSSEVEIMQLTDLLIGAISYVNRGLSTSEAKANIVDRIQKRSGYDLIRTTLLRENKVNLFRWHPSEVQG